MSEIAKQGYLVIGSQYRGSSKNIPNNGFDQFGGTDVNDVIALTRLTNQIPFADNDNIHMIGWSRGVMQSFIAAKLLPNLISLVAIAGNSDTEKALAWRPDMEKSIKNVYLTLLLTEKVNLKSGPLQNG